MGKLNKVLFLFLLLLVSFSCKKSDEETTVSGYIEYVKNSENGLYNSKILNDIKFELQYEPLEYEVLKANKKNRSISNSFLKKESAKLDSMCYFIFRISHKSGDLFKTIAANKEEYYGLKQYFIQEAQNDISLELNGETIQCGMYHYEASANSSSGVVLVTAFPLSSKVGEINNDIQFTYDDKIFGLGPVKFLIKKSDLKNIPILKMP